MLTLVCIGHSGALAKLALAAPLELRASSGPIYGSSGGPLYTDVGQTTNPDCGFAASLAAVARVSPDWISSKMQVTGPINDATSVVITMYDPKTLASSQETVTCADTAQHSDDKTSVWWPGAYDHAAVAMGDLPVQNGVLSGVLPSSALSTITGLAAQWASNGQQLTADEIFQYATEAASKNTPMIFQTKGSASVLVGDHAYAMFSGSGSGDNRNVTLYNPWGSEVTETVDSIVQDCQYVWFLTNHNTWTGGSSGGSTNQSSQAAPASQQQQPTPSSSRTVDPPPATSSGINPTPSAHLIAQPSGQTSAGGGGGGGGGGAGGSWLKWGHFGKLDAEPSSEAPPSGQTKETEDVVVVTDLVWVTTVI